MTVRGGPADKSQLKYEYAADPKDYDVSSRGHRVYVRVSAPGYKAAIGWNSVNISKVGETQIELDSAA